MVRKSGEGNHAGGEILSYYPVPGKVVILDDFVASGNTISTIYEELTKDPSKGLVPVGIYLYRHFGTCAIRGVDLPLLSRNVLDTSEMNYPER